MAAPVGLHADAVYLNRLIGDNMLSAGNVTANSGYAFLTDTNVAAADTVTGLTAAVDAASAHADQSYAKARFDLAITLGTYDGSFTDARILSLTTVAGLVGLTNALTTDSVQQQIPE
jgi:hypothetical protein